MNKIVLVILLMMSLSIVVQSKNYMPGFAHPLPFKGLAGKPKMTEVTWTREKITAKGDTISDQYQTYTSFFNRKGQLDSMYIFMPAYNKLTKIEYDRKKTSKQQDFGITNGDTILLKTTIYKYAWLDKETLLATLTTTENNRKDNNEIKQDTIYCDWDQQSIKEYPNEGYSITRYYKDNKLIKEISGYESETITAEYTYDGNMEQSIRYSSNGEVIEVVHKEIKKDNKGNWTEIIIENQTNNFQHTMRKTQRIVY